jgi:hypothetical protein
MAEIARQGAAAGAPQPIHTHISSYPKHPPGHAPRLGVEAILRPPQTLKHILNGVLGIARRAEHLIAEPTTPVLLVEEGVKDARPSPIHGRRVLPTAT